MAGRREFLLALPAVRSRLAARRLAIAAGAAHAGALRFRVLDPRGSASAWTLRYVWAADATTSPSFSVWSTTLLCQPRTLLGYVDTYNPLTFTQELLYYSFWRDAQEVASLGKEPKIP